MTQKPLVAIRCTTYNQEPYIRETLEGFVMQKTEFPFVAIVHDDASTDTTPDIIREYAEKYPDIIKPIFETENQHSKKDGSLRRIMNEATEATGAEFTAFCEGDDYWIDPLKLQKQVSFLQNNLDYGMSVTACRRYYQQLGEFREYNIGGDITFEKLLNGNIIHTPSVVVRTELLTLFYSSGIIEELQITSMGDYQRWLWLSANSKIHYLQDVTTVYRILQKSASHGSYKKWLDFMIDSISIRKFFSNRFGLKRDMPIKDIAYNLAKANYLNDIDRKKELQSSAKLLDTTSLTITSKLIRLMIIYVPQCLSAMIQWRHRQEDHPSWIYSMVIKCKSH